MREPKVSIVIPVYNGADFMREAINSALNQSYKNCEVIVVNDGSKDNTEEVALSYGSKIRYFSKENGGVSTALNLGIENMEGQYFSYLPHDDILHLDKIRMQMEAILHSGDDMSIVWSGWNFYFQESGKRQPFSFPLWLLKENVTKGVYPLFFGLLNTVSVLLHREYFKKVGRFDPVLRTSQDYDMWFRAFKSHQTIYIEKELVDYRIHEKQGTQDDPEYTKNCIELAMKMMEQISQDDILYSFGSQYAFYCQLTEYYREMDWEECFRYAGERWMEIPEPKDAGLQREELKRYLYQLGNSHDIILYGAGRNGKRLFKDLENRGIHILAWCDSDIRKQGENIDGRPCLAPEQIRDIRCLTVVTTDEPEQLTRVLTEQGHQHVVGYKEIADVLYHTLPMKASILGEG